MSVARVNALLDELAELACKDKDLKNPARLKIFREFVHNLPAMQHKWLISIILKDLKAGFSEGSVFSVLHKSAHDLWTTCTDLKKVCEELNHPDVVFDNNAVTLFQPFKPMLGQRWDGSIPKVVKLLDHDFFIETKFDGERIQLHKVSAEKAREKSLLGKNRRVAVY